MKIRCVGTILAWAVLAAVAQAPAHAQRASIPVVVAVPLRMLPPLRPTGPTVIGAPAGLAFPQVPLSPEAAITPVGGPALFAEMVATDPLVRQIQVGPAPAGVLVDVNPATGIGVANIPGIGARTVRVVGPPIQTPAGPALRAVDATTGLQIVALTPTQTAASANSPGPLMPAAVTRVTPDGVIVERTVNGQRVTEIVPAGQVYSDVGDRFVLSASVRRLRPGARVFIPLRGTRLGTIVVTRPAGFGSRATSTRAGSEKPAR